MSVNAGNTFCTFSDAVIFGQRVKTFDMVFLYFQGLFFQLL
jgi:hypothetical protein